MLFNTSFIFSGNRGDTGAIRPKGIKGGPGVPGINGADGSPGLPGLTGEFHILTSHIYFNMLLSKCTYDIRKTSYLRCGQEFSFLGFANI